MVFLLILLDLGTIINHIWDMFVRLLLLSVRILLLVAPRSFKLSIKKSILKMRFKPYTNPIHIPTYFISIYRLISRVAIFKGKHKQNKEERTFQKREKWKEENN